MCTVGSHGLQNSNAVQDSTGSHWYCEEAEAQLWGELADSDEGGSTGEQGAITNLSENLMSAVEPTAPAIPADVATQSACSWRDGLDGAHSESAKAVAPVLPPTASTACASRSAGSAAAAAGPLSWGKPTDVPSIPHAPSELDWLSELKRRFFGESLGCAQGTGSAATLPAVAPTPLTAASVQ